MVDGHQVLNKRCPHILVVEDDDDVRQLLAIALGGEGYDVDVAASAEEGLEHLTHKLFHLILTDYALPRRNGAWMLEEAQKRGCLGATPALVLTAHPRPVGIEPYPVVQKPIDLDLFLQQVRGIITNQLSGPFHQSRIGFGS